MEYRSIIQSGFLPSSSVIAQLAPKYKKHYITLLVIPFTCLRHPFRCFVTFLPLLLALIAPLNILFTLQRKPKYSRATQAIVYVHKQEVPDQ